MDSRDRMVSCVVTVGLLFTAYLLHLNDKHVEAEMKFKYEAALNGAPVAVCVK